jgi:hypothetical protein
MAMIAVRGTPRRRLLAAFVIGFVATISASTLVWPRWIIPVLPVLVLFAASAVVTIARMVAARAPTPVGPHLDRVLVAMGTCALAFFIVVMVIRLDQRAEVPSTRELMRAWIVGHVPRGTPIAAEIKSPELRTAAFPTLQRFDLPHDGTVADYVAHGYRDFLVNAYVALDYRAAARRYPKHAAFYEFLRRHATLLHEEQGRGETPGPHLKLYRVDLVQLAAAHGRVDFSTTQRSRHDRLVHPKPFYPVGDSLLR